VRSDIVTRIYRTFALRLKNCRRPRTIVPVGRTATPTAMIVVAVDDGWVQVTQHAWHPRRMQWNSDRGSLIRHPDGNTRPWVPAAAVEVTPRR